VLFPAELHVPRRLAKTRRRSALTITYDRAFSGVIRGCASPRGRRPEDAGTWLNGDMIAAYEELAANGYAHSVEAWDPEGRLVGGLYGVALGRAFFGESMFTRVTDASKVAFVRFIEDLAAHGFHMVDCQVYTEHLARFGAREIPRARFLTELAGALAAGEPSGPWQSPAAS
jgi:leucyl/phenylalanyl-tRNA--protein transferase